MQTKRLTQEFYKQPATVVAPLLLGKLLCRKINGVEYKSRITETECYFGEEDTACHASKGKTERTKVLYEEGGIAYVYLCYGIHNLLNVVTGDEGHPEAVLIRGIEGYNGPGKLTKAMEIDRSFNGLDLCESEELWFEDTGEVVNYKLDKRVGIEYATPEYRDILWRYLIVD